MQHLRLKPNPALIYIIKGLIPYTGENISLAYKPSVFFNELERIIDREEKHKISRKSIEATYYRAKRDGYFRVTSEKKVVLDESAHHYLELYEPSQLKGAKLLVTFDIYETERHKRAQLRQLLRVLKFNHVQKSVWTSDYDGRKALLAELEKLELQSNVNIYEAYKLT